MAGSLLEDKDKVDKEQQGGTILGKYLEANNKIGGGARQWQGRKRRCI